MKKAKPPTCPEMIAKIAGSCVFVLGAAVLMGWMFDLTALKSVFPGLATMKANTATGMLLCGGALALLSPEKIGKPMRLSITVMAVAVAALGTLTLGEYLLGRQLGMDQLLFRDVAGTMETSEPVRMSPATAFCFLLTGCSLLAASHTSKMRARLCILAALSVALIAVDGLALIGYASEALFSLGWWNSGGMAVHTAAGFLLLGCGLLALVKNAGELEWSLNTLTTSGFVVGIVSLVAMAGMSFRFTNLLQQSADWVSHTQGALKEIEAVKADVATIVSSQRNYINMGNEQLLEQAEEINAALHKTLVTLRKLTADAPNQGPRLDRLERLIAQRLEWGEQTVVVRRQQGLPAVEKIIAAGRGVALYESIRRVTKEMKDEEYSLLDQGQKKEQAISTTTFLLLPLGVILSLTMLCVGLFFLNAGAGDRTRAEQAAAQLAAIVKSSSDAVVGKDLQGNVTSWNAGAERMFGYAADEILGQSIFRIIPTDHQDDEERILARIRRGESVEHFETERLRKDGKMIDVSVTVSPIKNAAGDVVGASKVARDITERRKAEEARRASEARYRALFENAPDGIVIANSESHYIDANASICRMLGYSRGEMIGLHASDIVAQTEIERIGPALSEIEANSDWHREWQLRRKDGSIFAAEVIATPMPDGNLLGMIRDITERKAVEEKIRHLNVELEQRVIERTGQLQNANKELHAFSYSVSHDLRAPLRHVLGYVDLLQKEAGPSLSEKGLRHLATISGAAKRMGNLIDDLLAFSRIGQSEIQKKEVHLDQLVRDTLGDFQTEIRDRNIEWKIDPLPLVWADRDLLRMVLVNLISNAVKFTSHRLESKIEIGCAPNGNGESVIFVRDNGAGFDPKYAGKLFGVFQRLHRQDEFEGTGIGLANVQRIIHRHGGRVWAEGVVDTGATFSFSMPKQMKS